jgi:hypothetical protein
MSIMHLLRQRDAASRKINDMAGAFLGAMYRRYALVPHDGGRAPGTIEKLDRHLMAGEYIWGLDSVEAAGAADVVRIYFRITEPHSEPSELEAIDVPAALLDNWTAETADALAAARRADWAIQRGRQQAGETERERELAELRRLQAKYPHAAGR